MSHRLVAVPEPHCLDAAGWSPGRQLEAHARTQSLSPPPECCPGAGFVSLLLGSGTIKGTAVRAEKPRGDACPHVHTRARTCAFSAWDDWAAAGNYSWE